MSNSSSPLEVKAPAPKAGESSGEYIDRLNWEKERLHPDLLNKPMRGYIATPFGLKHWTRAYYLGEVGTDKQRINPNHKKVTVHQLDYTPPPIVKRTPQQRLEELAGMLFELAKQCYDGTGVIRFPRSVVNEIVDTYRQMGAIKTPEDIEKESLEGIRLALDEWGKRILNQNQSIQIRR